MIGDMLAQIRKEKGITKTELAKITGINIGHLTHIEKGERNPSHKALKNICKALNVPYQQLMFTYDKSLNEEQEKYNAVKHISYNKILAVDSICDFVDCPAEFPSSAIAIKVNDDSMEPLISKNSFVFVEYNSPLNKKDLGIFYLNGSTIIREFSLKKDSIILKSKNEKYPDISLKDNDEFYIIGKVFIKK